MHDASCHSQNLVTCLLVQSIAGMECGIGYAGVLLSGLTIEVILTLRNKGSDWIAIIEIGYNKIG